MAVPLGDAAVESGDVDERKPTVGDGAGVSVADIGGSKAAVGDAVGTGVADWSGLARPGADSSVVGATAVGTLVWGRGDGALQALSMTAIDASKQNLRARRPSTLCMLPGST